MWSPDPFLRTILIINSAIRLVGLILLLWSPYWYGFLIGILAIGLVPSKQPDGRWAWRFFHNDALDGMLRVITELFVLALSLWGIYIFPYIERTTAEWLAGAAAIVCFGSWIAVAIIAISDSKNKTG